jgi:hypothetical protein
MKLCELIRKLKFELIRNFVMPYIAYLRLKRNFGQSFGNNVLYLEMTLPLL